MARQILILFLAIFFLVLGTVSGIFYQNQKDAPFIQKAYQADKLMDLFNSKIIAAITASGTVTDINGNTITISSDNKSLKFNLRENANIYFVQDVTNSTQQKAEVKDITKGKTVFTTLTLLPNGQFESSLLFLRPNQ